MLFKQHILWIILYWLLNSHDCLWVCSIIHIILALLPFLHHLIKTTLVINIILNIQPVLVGKSLIYNYITSIKVDDKSRINRIYYMEIYFSNLINSQVIKRTDTKRHIIKRIPCWVMFYFLFSPVSCPVCQDIRRVQLCTLKKQQVLPLQHYLVLTRLYELIFSLLFCGQWPAVSF